MSQYGDLDKYASGDFINDFDEIVITEINGFPAMTMLDVKRALSNASKGLKSKKDNFDGIYEAFAFYFNEYHSKK